MRRHRDLFAPLTSRANLWAAWRDFLRGKRGRPRVQRFRADAGRHLDLLQRELTSGRYRPSGYRTHVLREPKPRLIAAAPVRDRVVHHAIVRTLGPVLDRSLIDDTYACRAGGGTHRAVLRFLGGLRRYRFVVLLDVRRYFPSVDHAILLELMARQLKERPLLDLLAAVVASGEGLYRQPGVAEALGFDDDPPLPGRGLPIGNLTSQWWGNHYLSGADHRAQSVLRIPRVLRYMDDVALFSDDRAQLLAARDDLGAWLASARHLWWKRPDAAPRSTRETFRYLGFRVSRGGIGPTAEAKRRAARLVRAAVLSGDDARVQRTTAAVVAHLTFRG